VVHSFAPPITNPRPDLLANLNRGLVDKSFIACSRAVPLLAVRAIGFCGAEEFGASEVDFDFRVISHISFFIRPLRPVHQTGSSFWHFPPMAHAKCRLH